MDTRRMAGELRLEYWAGVQRERNASGMSIRAWCQENGIGEKQYFYWQKKLRERVCESIAEREDTAVENVPQFAQIQMAPHPTNSSRITIRLEDAEIEIEGDASPASIEAVLRALGSR